MNKTVLHIIIWLLFVAGCNSNEKQENEETNAKQEHEGMDMEAMPGMAHQSESSDNGFQNMLSPANKIVFSNAKTIHPQIKNLSDTIYGNGYIAFDERRNNKVAIRVAGRIEKLYFKYNYQYVHKGNKLLELYSPELNTYQEEFLHHLKTKSDSFLVDATRQKLTLLGLSARQLREIISSGQPLKTITIFSAYDGFIIYDFPQQQNSVSQNIPAAATGMNGMNGTGSQQSAPSNPMQSGSRISEGDYLSKGQTLFVLNDCKEVYAIVAFDASDGTAMKPNVPVKIKSQLVPGEDIDAVISFIEPTFKDGQTFLQARVYLKNENLKLKINSNVSVEFSETLRDLVIPTSAVLSLGNRKYVWLRKDSAQQGSKMLQVLEIKVGKEYGGYIQVLSGITPMDEIAKDAGYLLDSESLIKPEPK